MVLSVRFVGFWPGFDPEDFFLPIFRLVFGCEVYEAVGYNGSVLEVYSVFIHEGRSHPLMKVARGLPRLLSRFSSESADHSSGGARKIWYTGENRRPPANGYSATLSFDATGGDNFYLPLWWLLFPAPGSRNEVTSESYRLGIQPSLTEAVNGRNLPKLGNRSKFACTFIGKPETTRLKMIRALESVGEVDKFGAHFGNPVDHKFPIATDYDFVICPENSTYPGYITEKAIEAWASGAIPLYLGNDVHGDLNPGALVNLNDYANIDDFCAVVKELTSNPIKIESMRKRNILNRAPDYEGLVDFLRAALE